MRKCIWMGMVCVMLLPVFQAKAELSETQKLASLCKVWGFLKYHHPKAARGKLDWDKELMDRIPTVIATTDAAALDNLYISWIHSLGGVKACRKCKDPVPDSLGPKPDFAWMDDAATINPELKDMLLYIRQNHYTGRNYYVHSLFGAHNTGYPNEKKYKLSGMPSLEFRMLTLFRYWNIIQYFYPYKNIIPRDWNLVLDDLIPRFAHPADTTDYHLAVRLMVVAIHDSHAGYSSEWTSRYFGKKWMPFITKIVENKVVVNEIFGDSICKADDIRVGDVIIKVGSEDMDDRMAWMRKYMSASNESVVKRNMYALLNGNTDTVQVEIMRGGVVMKRTLHRLTSLPGYHPPKIKACKMLKDSIGYINMGVFQPKQVDSAMKQMMGTKAIIFDVRNYPNGTMYGIADYLNPENTAFATFTEPDVRHPGSFRRGPVYHCGRHNPNYYKGLVVVLFNESTQSHAEFTCMSLKTAPHVICIGSQTAGADGNVSEIPFPDGHKTYMTGIGVFYPNGTPTQGIGIVPDIEIRPTIAGVQAGRDEVLERALQYIKQNTAAR